MVVVAEEYDYGRISSTHFIYTTANGGQSWTSKPSPSRRQIFANPQVGWALPTGESNGLNLGWNPWLGALIGIGITTLLGFLLGALASRSAGIYFLMITLTYAVITNYFFGQVVTFSGFGGISGIHPPDLIGLPEVHPFRLYYTALFIQWRTQQNKALLTDGNLARPRCPQ